MACGTPAWPHALPLFPSPLPHTQPQHMLAAVPHDALPLWLLMAHSLEPVCCTVQGRVGGGEVIHIHSADMRTLVALSFSPDGCQYAQRAPFVVSEGFYHSDAGGGGGSSGGPGAAACNRLSARTASAAAS